MIIGGSSRAGFENVNGKIQPKQYCDLIDQFDLILSKAQEIKAKLKWGLSEELRDLIYWARYDDLTSMLRLGIKDQKDTSTRIQFAEFEYWVVNELKVKNISLNYAVELVHPRIPSTLYSFKNEI